MFLLGEYYEDEARDIADRLNAGKPVAGMLNDFRN